MGKVDFEHNGLENRELTLKDIQRVSFDILLDVHDFCVENKITYSLAYGTLIGAVRHKGFIPWDDDVDIIMPRSCFERFCNEYVSQNGFKVLGPNSSECLIPYARVYDTSKTIVKTNAPWSSFETGVWIDVFPIDGVDSDMEVFLRTIRLLKPIAHMLGYKRNSYESFSLTHPFRRKITWVAKRLLTFRQSFSELLEKYNGIITSHDYSSSEYFGQLACFDGGTTKEHHPKTDFDFTIDVEFEGYAFKAMNGYHNVLTRYYGDYMQLPPVEDQVPQQNSYMKFYWK